MVTSMTARHALGRAGLDIALRPAVLLARPHGWGGGGGCARVRCLHVSSVLLRSPPMIRFRYGNNKGGSARRLALPTPASPWLSALPVLPFCTVASLFPHPRGAGCGFVLTASAPLFVLLVAAASVEPTASKPKKKKVAAVAAAATGVDMSYTDAPASAAALAFAESAVTTKAVRCHAAGLP
jgi:hypothetical protein